jgi:hypothetical protein
MSRGTDATSNSKPWRNAVTMGNNRTRLLKSIDRLVESIANRVTFWPLVEEHLIETSRLDFAQLLVEKYIEILGLTRVANIIRSSTTEQEILEALEEEIALRETKELEILLKDKEDVIVPRHELHSRLG